MRILSRMTPKQHAVCQMLCHAVPNVDIGKVLGIKENSVKVHVRAVAKKFGVRRREQTAIAYQQEMDALFEDDYRSLSGGLPNDWWPDKAAAGENADIIAPSPRHRPEKLAKRKAKTSPDLT